MDQWESQLTSLLPPPTPQILVDDSTLHATEARLGIHLPSDYVSFCRSHGPGSICVTTYSFVVSSPFTEIQSASSLVEYVDYFGYAQREMRRGLRVDDTGLRIFPEAGGLLPFACIDATHFTWKTIGSPDQWTIVVLWYYENGGFVHHDMGFNEFWVKLLNREIVLGPCSDTWNPETDISFMPIPIRPGRKRRP